MLQWPETCEQAFVTTHASYDGGLTFHRLADGVTLVQVTCAAGAYQGSSVFVRLDETTEPAVARTLTFTTFTSADGATLEPDETVEVWGETTVLAETQQLTVLTVARQLRDCGTWARYALDAPEPRVVEVFAQVVCPEEPGPPAQPEPGRPPDGWVRIPTN